MSLRCSQQTPYDVRKSEFRKLTDNIVGLVVTSRMDMERLTFFGHTWHDPIFNAVKSDRRNFENTDRWLRVQVVLEYIHAITKHKFVSSILLKTLPQRDNQSSSAFRMPRRQKFQCALSREINVKSAFADTKTSSLKSTNRSMFSQ